MRRHPRRRPQVALHATIGERLPAIPTVTLPPPRRPWTPSHSTKAMLTAIAALPRLAASVGMIAADPSAEVELLPGAPTTLVFTAAGHIRGLFILPIAEDEAQLLHLPEATNLDPFTLRLWEDEIGRAHV